MKITVTRQEIEQTKSLLDYIKNLEEMQQSTRQYANGSLNITRADGLGTHSLKVPISYLACCDVSTPRKEAEREVEALASHLVDKFLQEAIQISLRHMPLPLE